MIKGKFERTRPVIISSGFGHQGNLSRSLLVAMALQALASAGSAVATPQARTSDTPSLAFNRAGGKRKASHPKAPKTLGPKPSGAKGQFRR